MTGVKRKSGAPARLSTFLEGLLYSASRTLRVRGRGPVLRYYELFHDLFDTVSRGSGILNIGYAEDPERADVTEAQKDMVRLVLSALPEKERLLDVGCGVGGPACLAAEENEGADVTGINITGIHVECARKRAEERGLGDRVRFLLGDAQDMPFGHGSFCGLYAIETAFHYPDKARFAREAHRVLRKGGGLSVADIVWSRPMRGARDRLLSFAWKQAMSSPEIFTAEKWRQSLEEAGFRDVRVADITRETLTLLPRWRERMDAHREELSRRYPDILLRAALLSFRLTESLPSLSPIAYVHVTARK